MGRAIREKSEEKDQYKQVIFENTIRNLTPLTLTLIILRNKIKVVRPGNQEIILFNPFATRRRVVEMQIFFYSPKRHKNQFTGLNLVTSIVDKPATLS